MRSQALFLGSAVLAALSASLAASNAAAKVGGPSLTDILPDFRPWWGLSGMQDIRIDHAQTNDRLVSCDDWTQIDPRPITGQRVLSFTLASGDLGAGHLRISRLSMADGIHMISIGALVACQTVRWCCLVNIPACDTTPPCALG
jgi:hypothetical protein